MNFLTYEDCLSYLASLINTQTVRHMGAYGLERMKQLLEKLGNPQDSYPVIHIAGTSGKGSTATICSHLLTAHDYKTGLHVSPHLINFRERVEIDNQYIDNETFVTACQTAFPFVESMRESVRGLPSYYEASMAVIMLCFAMAKVDVAVIEVGCGGLYDGSNCIQRSDKISIINALGYDHTHILGETIEEIAFQKAGIILTQSTCISLLHPQPSCRQIISDIAERKNATLIRVDSAEKFDYEVSLIGRHQITNAHLAYKAIELFLSRQGRTIDTSKTDTALQHISIPGRCHLTKIQGKNILLDGAHNEQKMYSLIQTLKEYFPEKKYHFYLAFKEGKDRPTMIDAILPHATSIAIGEFEGIQDTPFQSISSESIKSYIDNHNDKVATSIIHPTSFITDRLASFDKNDIIVCTGSLYRLSDLYTKRKII